MMSFQEVNMPASKALRQVSREVFKRVKKAGSPLRPTELLAEFTPEYSYAELQDALSRLLEDQEISLTPDRYLIISGKV
jgi:hypothetical protein